MLPLGSTEVLTRLSRAVEPSGNNGEGTSLHSEKNAGPSNHIYKADFSSLFLLPQSIERNGAFLGGIHPGKGMGITNPQG